jgi:hypothetical protein
MKVYHAGKVTDREVARKKKKKKEAKMMSFRLPGWGGVLQQIFWWNSSACPARQACSLTRDMRTLRKETHHQKACLGDLLAPGIGRVNGKSGPGMHCKND